jgi:hypothetical protein
MGAGVATVFDAATEILRRRPSPSKMMMFIDAPPVFDRNVIFSRENLEPFARLVEHEQPGPTLAAYEKTLCYIGYLRRSIEDDEPIYVVGRKIISFAILIPRTFVALVEQEQPLALVILAHYFALMTRAQSIWWIGKTPRREIEAIHHFLPPEWHDRMRWPRMMAGLTVF